MSDYKYIILSDGEREYPIIFAGEIIHKEMAFHISHALARRREHAIMTGPVAAGFVYLGDVKIDTKGSESLGIEPRIGDADVINLHPQTHGLVDNIPTIRMMLDRAKNPQPGENGVSKDVVRRIGGVLREQGFKDVKSDLIRAAVAAAHDEERENPRAMTEVPYNGEIASCPHCQALNVFVRRPHLDSRYHVECRICDMRGPTSTSVDAAVFTWTHLLRPPKVTDGETEGSTDPEEGST